MLAAQLTNISGKTLPDHKAVSPLDFMPLSVNKHDNDNRALIQSLLAMGAKVVKRDA